MNHYIQNPMVEIGGNWWKLVEIGLVGFYLIMAFFYTTTL